MSQCDTMWHGGQALGVQSIQWLKFVRCKGTLHGISIWTKCDAIRDKHGFVIQIYTPMDCSQATSCSSDSTDTHRATHHRLIAGTQSDRMCDNTRHFYVVVQSAKKKRFQKLLTFCGQQWYKANDSNYMSTCTEWMMIDLPNHCWPPSFTQVERSLWQWLSIAGTIWQNGSMASTVACRGQVPGVTPNETRDPDGTGRIVKFGPDRVEACERCGGCFSWIWATTKCESS